MQRGMTVPIANGDCEVMRGDVVRSEYGRSKRLVVGFVSGKVVVLTPRGKIDSIPVEGVQRYWKKVGTADPDNTEGWADEVSYV